MTTHPVLAPRLVVSDGRAALVFYRRAFAATTSDEMYAGERLVNAHVHIGDTEMGVTEEDGEHNLAPSTLGGTPVMLSVTVADVDEAAARFLEAGGEVIIPVADRPYGRRDGRFRDASGHMWILGQQL